MTFDSFGKRNRNSPFDDFVTFIENESHDGWEYYGMKVELDPTVDFKNETIKVRWQDLDEGFNDKLILKNKKEFLDTFSKIS
ncbi:MAG: hypothetical protein IKP49_05935 [Treponema sp.]|nr:hypothetical protein [Treponema sp.]MBR6912766.1 hypothetical protein [Treponema sp.]